MPKTKGKHMQNTAQKQQKLIAFQAVLFSILFSIVVVVSAVVYSKTTLFDEEKDAKKVKKIDENKIFEEMYKEYKN